MERKKQSTSNVDPKGPKKTAHEQLRQSGAHLAKSHFFFHPNTTIPARQTDASVSATLTMARRKNHRDDFLHDDDNDDDTTSDELNGDDIDDAVDAGIGQPSRKRMRRTKESAIYGIFGEDENEKEGGGGRSVRARGGRGRKIDYRKGQAFVPASTSQPAATEEAPSEPHIRSDDPSTSNIARVDAEKEDEEDDFQPASFYSTRPGIGSTGAREPREPREPKATKKPARPGIGARAGIGSSSSNDAEAGPSSRRSGLTSLSMFVSAGATKPSDTSVPPHNVTPDIPDTPAAPPPQPSPAASPPPPTRPTPDEHDIATEQAQLTAAGLPTTFSTPQPTIPPSSAFQRSFSKPAPVAPPKTSIKFGNKFDPSAYLASMGWTGGGLGRSGQGIVNPIEVQLRPERAGIAYGGLKEKTAQAKAEARRRGEDVSSDEESRPRSKDKRAGGKVKKETKEWTKAPAKPRKPKIEHRTYEEIIAEIGSLPATHSTLGKIYDASSGELREVSDLATTLGRKGLPTAAEELPELQHNLRLICDTNAQTLAALAREGVQIQDRKRWATREEEMARRKIVLEERKLVRIRGALEVVKELEAVSRRIGGDVGEEEGILEEFTPLIERLEKDYRDDISELALDEAVVGAIAPVLRALWSQWRPFKQPTFTTSYLSKWAALVPTQDTLSTPASGTMTPFDTLLWTHWMPTIRSSFIDFKPHHPSSAVSLLETWRPLLPRFIFDNVIDQLLLPALHRSLSSWDARTSKYGLEHILFPWLPLLGVDRLTDVLAEAKRKLRSGLKLYPIARGPPHGLSEWRRFYTTHSSLSEWETLLLSTIVPRLASHLKSLRISRSGKPEESMPLSEVLRWKKIVGKSTMVKILTGAFFERWFETLCGWLRQPMQEWMGVDVWYVSWRRWWVESVGEGSDDGFAVGLALINSALDMDDAERRSLKVPLYNLSKSVAPTPAATASEKVASGEANPVSFRTILAEELAHYDLFLFKTSQVKSTGITTTANIWRVSGSPGGGAKAALVYIEDDVVFQQSNGGGAEQEWVPVSIDQLVQSLTA